MLLKFINNSLKQYFNSDPEVAAQLQDLADQYLLLKLTDVKKQFLITPTDSSIVVTEYKNGEDKNEITTTIHSNVITLLRLTIRR